MRSAAFMLAMLLCTTATNAQNTGGYAKVSGGGKSVTVSSGKELHQAICGRSSSSEKLTIYVKGTINHGNTAKASGKGCPASSGDRIELKRVKNLAIIGKGAVFDQIGIHIREAENIILQNLHIKNVKKSNGKTSNGGDAIGMDTNVKNVWVDHCTLEASGGESAGYDGLCDMKAGTKYVTVSYTIFKNSGRGGLVGSSDNDKGNGPVTFHHNLYSNIDSRTPLLRSATAHAYNNYYTKINKSGLNPRNGGKVKVEGCVFENAKSPLGTFYTDKKGSWQVKDNIFKSVKWGSGSAGPNVKSTTSISIPYSYKLDRASSAKGVVQSMAGANKGMKTSGGGSSSPPPSPPSSQPSPSSPPSAPSPSRPSPPSGGGGGSCTAAWGNCKNTGCCVSGYSCVKSNKYYSQCKKGGGGSSSPPPRPSAPSPSRPSPPSGGGGSCTAAWGNCKDTGCCVSGYKCKKANKWYSQCKK